jgi:hypothetical protein
MGTVVFCIGLHLANLRQVGNEMVKPPALVMVNGNVRIPRNKILEGFSLCLVQTISRCIPAACSLSVNNACVFTQQPVKETGLNEHNSPLKPSAETINVLLYGKTQKLRT